jgi:hypothetical protein
MNWFAVPSGITETCVGMRTFEFDPLFRTAMRGFLYGQKFILHKQAGYICADRLFQLRKSACKRAADHTLPTDPATKTDGKVENQKQVFPLSHRLDSSLSKEQARPAGWASRPSVVPFCSAAVGNFHSALDRVAGWGAIRADCSRRSPVHPIANWSRVSADEQMSKNFCSVAGADAVMCTQYLIDEHTRLPFPIWDGPVILAVRISCDVNAAIGDRK